MNFYKLILFFLFFSSLSVLAQNELVTPKYDDYLPNNDIVFSWNAASEDISYNITISTSPDFSDVYFNQEDILLNFLMVNISESGKYYWKIQSYNGVFYSEWSPTYHFSVYTPKSLSEHCLFMLNADSVCETGGVIDTVYNYAGNTYYAFQTDPAAKPLLVTNEINGYPVIRFDGTDYLSGDGLVSDLLNYSFFIATKPAEFAYYRWLYQNSPFGASSSFSVTVAGGNSFMYWANSTSGDVSYLTPGSTTNFSLLSVVADNLLSSEKIKLFSNGYFDNSSNNTTGTNATPGYKIGALYTDTYLFSGDIAEIILFDEAVSDSIKYFTENYLRFKYQPANYYDPLNLGFNIVVPSGFCDTSISAYQPYFTDYEWNTGETDSLIHIVIEGTYSVTVTDVYGFRQIDSIKVIYPQAGFYSNTNLCMGDTIVWNTDQPSSFDFEWLGSAQTDSLIEISEAGQYAVKITDDEGCIYISDTITFLLDSISIDNALGPDRSVCSGEFLSLSSFVGIISDYVWNTGETSESIIISSPGTYFLSVTSPNNCVSVDSVDLLIKGVAPDVGFVSDTVCLGGITSLVDTSYVPAPDNIFSWSWVFNDTIFSSTSTATIQFDSAGFYPILLSVVSDSGCYSSLEDTVFVKNKPIALFETLFGDNQCVNQSVFFINNSLPSGEISYSDWYSNEVLFSSDYNSEFIFDTSGINDIMLIASHSNGCTDTVVRSVNISENLPLPSAFDLVSPVNNFLKYEEGIIDFSWNISENTIKYNLEISFDESFETIYFSSEYISENDFSYYISEPDTFFWRITSKNICGDSLVSATRFFVLTAFDTSHISLWFDANYLNEINGDSLITSFTDKKTGFVVYQNDNDKRPLLSFEPILNNKNTANFDGLNDSFISDSSLIISSIFVLCSYDKEEIIFPDYKAVICVPSTSVSNPHILLGNLSSSEFYNGGGSLFGDSIFINNYLTRDFSPINQYKIVHGVTHNFNTYDAIQIGSTNDFPTRSWNGNITEIMAFDTLLFDYQKTNIYRYFQFKYAPPVNLLFDIRITDNFCDTAINTAYKPWFTDYIWNTGETDSVIRVSDPGTYSVTVTDIFGFTSYDSIRISYPPLNAFSDSSICLFDTAIWKIDLEGDYSYLWSTGSLADSILLFEPGIYSVTITDTRGCTYSPQSITVTIDSFPQNASLGPDLDLCFGNQITLTSGEAETFLWSDGSTGEYFTVETAGEVWLTATNELGCIKTDTVEVISILGVAPVAGFEFANTCINQILVFTDTSFTTDGSNIVSWLWDFGNAENSSLPNPEVDYADTGTYLVTLTIETDLGCDNFTYSSVKVHTLPEIAFGPTQHCANDSIVFVNNSSIADGEIVGFEWDFGDSNSSTSTDPQHIYTSSGDYLLKLIAFSNQGCSDTLEQTLSIKPSPNADFTYSTPCAGYAIDFSDISYMPLPWSLIGWEWIIDGSPYSGSNVSALFTNPTTITASLSVQAVNGCWNNEEKEIAILDNPKAGFLGLQACVNTLHTLTDTSVTPLVPINSWFWEVENIGVFSSQNPEFIILDTGMFVVSLTVIDENNCYDFVNGNMIVSISPVANFSFSPWFGIPGSVIDFTNLTEDYSSLLWDFGDGNSDSEAEVIHAYLDSGNYEITLIAENEYSCADTITKSIVVIMPLYDVAVLSVNEDVSDNILKASAIIANFGSIPLYSLDLKLDFDKGSSITETWTGEFLPGTVLNYSFSSQYQVSEFTLPAYVCVEAVLENGLVDAVPGNNIKCNTEESIYEVLEPYPNPTNGEIIFELILPYQDILIVDVYESAGKMVKRMVTDKTVAGLNRIVFDASFLAKGVYNVWFNFEGSLKSLRFVKN